MPFFDSFKKQNYNQIVEQDEEQSVCENISSAVSPPWGLYRYPIRFSTTLGQAQTGDTSLLWSLVPPTSINGSDLAISFNRQWIVMPNIALTATPPTNIYIVIDNFSGFCDINGNVTGRVIKYSLKASNYNGTTPQTLTNIYQSDDVRWVLPKTTTLLNFRMFFDDNQTAQTTPLPFQISLESAILPSPFDRRFDQRNQGERECLIQMIYDRF